MKKLNYFIAALAVAISFSSCMTFDKTLYNNTTDGSNSSFITDRPYKVIEEISVREKSNYVFLIGGAKKNKKENVLHLLQKQANLKPNQALVNVSFSKTYKGFIIPAFWYQINNCAFGTIIEFTDVPDVNSAPDKKPSVAEEKGDSEEKIFVKEPNDVVNIPDKEFLKFLKKNFDTNKDGKISFQEAAAITQLSCSFWGITDLTGIESMVNLVGLQATGNRIVSVDLSNNEKLRYVSLTDKYLKQVFLSKNCSPEISFDKKKIIRK